MKLYGSSLSNEYTCTTTASIMIPLRFAV